VPEQLHIQEFDGSAWIGVVPFRMEVVMRRPLPDLPWISAFPEINVRTYVEHRGRSGIWFLSLDASNALAVWAARRWFHLPYFHAEMSSSITGDTVTYRSHRLEGASADFEAHYGPASTPYLATPGTLEHFLTERYCLFAVSRRGELSRTDVHHVPWPLQQSRAEIETNTMLAPHALALDDAPPLLHFSRRLDVVVWSPVIYAV